MVCATCRQYLEKTNPAQVEDVLDQVQGDLETEDYLGGQAYLEDDESQESKMESEDEELIAIELNKCYEALEQTPIKPKSKITPTYIKEKVSRATSALKRKFRPLSRAGFISESSDDESNTEINAEKAEKFDSLMNDLKDEFHKSATKSDKIKPLITVSKLFSARKLSEIFGTGRHIAQVAKNIGEEKGILGDPNPKKGNQLPLSTELQVKEFYKSEDISRVMPGKKDTVSVKDKDGVKKLEQKHLVLCNLKEAYQLFRDKYPNDDIGFSKFADLRPNECVLVGGSGTHSVCVCTTHENIKQIFLGAKLNRLHWADESDYTDYDLRNLSNNNLHNSKNRRNNRKKLTNTKI